MPSASTVRAGDREGLERWCRWGGRRVIVAELAERNVVVASGAHLKLPTEALPLARARSPAFEGA